MYEIVPVSALQQLLKMEKTISLKLIHPKVNIFGKKQTPSQCTSHFYVSTVAFTLSLREEDPHERKCGLTEAEIGCGICMLTFSKKSFLYTVECLLLLHCEQMYIDIMRLKSSCEALISNLED